VHVGAPDAARRELLSTVLRARTAIARGRRDEGGYTLVEMLLAAALALVVVGASVAVFTAGVHSEPRVTSRTASIQQARVVMERITRELRQGASVPTPGASQLAMVTYAPSASCAVSATEGACRVTYTCASGRCTRAVANPDGTAASAATEVVRGISNSSAVFDYDFEAGTGNVRYVQITLTFAAEDGNDAITLRDGVALRNEVAPA
jgi:type II secretory pathway pseudopilin PulG